MSNVSQTRGDIAGHPDAPEMRARYSRMLNGRDVVLVDGPVFLVGLYCAVSPWTIHFSGSQPELATHHLIVGVALGLLALGFTVAPERMYGLSWAMCAIGAWLVLSSWIVGTDPDAGIIWNNAIIGGLTFLLGLACAAVAMRTSRKVGREK
ncbi:SPW repeat protein [Streptomyces sp. N2-109]|uniref:SPW repeat protein n=1 Tax=Streptomyces gossypii TaxID=2883101 RepID=A0ABT2JQJ5_9ACTN|nr:SPW repeat protein [Streptomyces gossypii]MCT2590086.1 SPW repeat protein [Streptomyces gossypii]